MTACDRDLIKALADFAEGVNLMGEFFKGFRAGAAAAARHAQRIIESEDIPNIGPCAGCEYHEINRPDGAACAAGECVEREAI